MVSVGVREWPRFHAFDTQFPLIDALLTHFREASVSQSIAFHATAWMESAACREADPELFFPATATSRNKQSAAYRLHVVEAQDVCCVCPVQAECLEFALANPSIVGIWGGTTEADRQRIRRSRRREDRPRLITGGEIPTAARRSGAVLPDTAG